MKRYYIFACVCCCAMFTMHGFLDYDRAVSAAQNGDWQRADTMLSAMITDHPERPDLLYDAGVAAHEQKDFKRACTCFKNACAAPSCKPALKEQALFNCGNACVELKELKQALAQYEKVLQLNPKNEPARHNLEVVKKMLEQQQDNKEDQNKDKQDKDNKDKQDNKNKDDKNQQDKDKQDQKDKQQDKQDQKDQQDKNNDQQKSDKSQDEQKDQNKSDQDHDKKSKDEQSQDKQNSDQKKQDQSQQDKQQDQSQQDKQQEQKQKEQEQQKQGGDKKESGAQQQAAGKEQPYDEQVMGILNAVEKKDAQANKKMMAAQIKQAVGTYDKNQNNY